MSVKPMDIQLNTSQQREVMSSLGDQEWDRDPNDDLPGIIMLAPALISSVVCWVACLEFTHTAADVQYWIDGRWMCEDELPERVVLL